jgi:hypothetical protein
VPFQRLVANRDPDRLRGFRTGRFLGEGMLGINVDYRWPIMSLNDPADVGVDAFVFYDTGQPFFAYRELALERFHNCGGFGLRLIGPGGGFVLRTEVGFSNEAPVFRLDFSQLFLSEREGLYRGKVPIPAW